MARPKKKTATVKPVLVERVCVEPVGVQWAFPSKSRCPRCKTINTVAYSTDSENGVQYRKCLNSICRHRYKALGTNV